MARVDCDTVVGIERGSRQGAQSTFEEWESQPILDAVADRKVDEALHGREWRSLSEALDGGG